MNIDAKQSLCWNCKHSLCVRESELESLEQVGEEEQANIFDVTDNNNIIQHLIEREHIKAICFWKPNAPPILMANVRQCNRFEKQ